MNKPYIICHMMMSIDGRIDCGMTSQLSSSNTYYNILEDLHANGHLSGKTTALLEMADQGIFKPSKEECINQETFFKNNKKINCYEIVVDTKGTLLWSDTYDDSLLIIMSESTNKEYLDYLKNKNISYIVCGKEHIDLARVSEILFHEFDIHRLAVVGGGHINAGFLKEGLIDEVSVLIGPSIDGRKNMTALFDGLNEDYPLTKLKLKEIKQSSDGEIWIDYLVNKK